MWVGVGVVRVGCGIGGCAEESVVGWSRVPCFALEYAELVWDMHCCVAGLPLWVDRAGCCLRLYDVAGAGGCLAWYRGAGAWDGGSLMFGFFRRVVWWVRGGDWESSWV